MIPYFRSVLAAASVFSCSMAMAQPPADLSLQPVITSGSVSSPVALRHAGDGSGRLFVVEQGGNIRIITGGAVNSTAFITINSSTPGGFTGGGERGLLGLAFHPEFATNRKFYLNYTASGGHTKIVEYQASTANPNVADLTTRRELMTISQPASNHNGGDLAFGPDGYLYIPTGDGGGAGGSGQGFSQDLSNLLGKTLRIDVDATGPNAHACGGTGSLPYRIPADNPFVSGGGCSEIVHTGLRNPWRVSFDRQTGDMFIADVGQNAWEEVNFIASTELNQVKNFGWKCFEANATYTACPTGMAYPHTTPIITYNHSGGNCTIAGGYRYRGPITGLKGTYIFADYCVGRIQFATLSGSTWNVQPWGTALGFGVVAFGEDEQGNVYVVRQGGTTISMFHSAEVGEPETFTVTPVAGTGGAIAPNTPQEVEEGDTISFVVTANSGFTIDTVTGCGGTLAGTTYTTAAVTADCTVTASFEEVPPVTYTVTPVAGAGGSIDPNLPQVVNEGVTVSFVLTPDTGFLIDGVTGCGGTLAGDTYTTAAVTGNCTVSASFAEKPPGTWVVTPSAGAGGSLDPSTPQVVEDGDAISFDVIPDAGHVVDTVTGCGGSLAGLVYTTGAITGECSVIASFGLDPDDIIFIDGFESDTP